MNLEKKDIEKILTNPFYCLPKINNIFFYKHEPIITEEQFIKAGEKLIKEIGARKYIKILLKNLRGK
ncbi:hypothetical protein ES703_39923 [subsurface metagenome]